MYNIHAIYIYALIELGVSNVCCIMFFLPTTPRPTVAIHQARVRLKSFCPPSLADNQPSIWTAWVYQPKMAIVYQKWISTLIKCIQDGPAE